MPGYNVRCQSPSLTTGGEILDPALFKNPALSCRPSKSQVMRGSPGSLKRRISDNRVICL